MKINICSRQSKANSSGSILLSPAARTLGKTHETSEVWDCRAVICERRSRGGDCFLLGGAFRTGRREGARGGSSSLMRGRERWELGDTEVAMGRAPLLQGRESCGENRAPESAGRASEGCC